MGFLKTIKTKTKLKKTTKNLEIVFSNRHYLQTTTCISIKQKVETLTRNEKMFNQKNITLRPVITAGAPFIHPLIICWSRLVKIHLYLQVPADLQPCELLPGETKQPPCVATTVCFYAQFIQSDACLCFSQRVRCNSCVQSPAGATVSQSVKYLSKWSYRWHKAAHPVWENQWGNKEKLQPLQLSLWEGKKHNVFDESHAKPFLVLVHVIFVFNVNHHFPFW